MNIIAGLTHVFGRSDWFESSSEARETRTYYRKSIFSNGPSGKLICWWIKSVSSRERILIKIHNLPPNYHIELNIRNRKVNLDDARAHRHYSDASVKHLFG